MKLTQILLTLALSGAWATTSTAKEALGPTNVLGQAYLSNWFAIDSAEAMNLSLSPINGISESDRVRLSFTSDDGQIVNGVLAYPQGKKNFHKIAFAMHPMGADQDFWWHENSPLDGNKLTASLLEQGYIVISLDARRHGKRGTEGFGAQELLRRARSDEPRLYIDTIIGSVRDYRAVLNWAKRTFKADDIVALGYSMGAQMSLLLASYEPNINHLLVMVPPYIGDSESPVAPRTHVARISNANVQWLAGTKDPHSNRLQTEETFNRISSTNKHIAWFDSGHRLPATFMTTALSFIDSLGDGDKQ